MHGHRGSSALIRVATVGTAAVAVFVTVLSLPGILNRSTMIAGWSSAAVIFGAVLAWRYRAHFTYVEMAALPSRGWRKVRHATRRLSAIELVGGGFLVLLLAGELLAGLYAPPTSLDSLAYHLPRVEHWRANQSVGPYPAAISRQVMFAPGAEYLMLVVRLLADSVWLAPLVAWLATVGVVVVSHRVAGQLGCGRTGRMGAAVLAGTVPMLVIHASSTLNDPVVAFFLLAFVSLVLEWQSGADGWRLAAVTGLALGAAVLVKSTAIPIALGFGLWWLVLLLRRGRRGMGWGGVGALASLVVVGPFLAMVASVWGSPLGGGNLTEGVVMRRLDPPSIGLNALRFTSSELLVGNHHANGILCGGVRRVYGFFGLSADDPRTTFFSQRFDCQYQVGEMMAPAALHTGLAIIAVLALLLVGSTVHRVYVLALLTSGLAISGVLAYQIWIARLLLPLLLLAMPLIPVAAARITIAVPRVLVMRRIVGISVVAALMVISTQALGYGSPRPLALMDRDDSSQPVDQRLLDAYPSLRAGLAQVRASGAKVVGVSEYENGKEFATWVVLGADRDRVRLLMLDRAVPGQVADTRGMDALVCEQTTVRDCDRVLPAGWQVTVHKGKYPVVVALPPQPVTEVTG